MRRASWWLMIVAGVAGCKTEAARRTEVMACSERSGDALEIELCLTGNYRWKEPEARAAAAVRAKELDSLERLRDDAAWAESGARRRAEILQCGDQELETCLLVTFGWPKPRADAAAESVWTANVARHQREVRDCSVQRQSSVGSCLMLRYKWPDRRALKLDDSIMRERLR